MADSDDYPPLPRQLDVATLAVPAWVTELAAGSAAYTELWNAQD